MAVDDAFENRMDEVRIMRFSFDAPWHTLRP
jgi:hypothetical protein